MILKSSKFDRKWHKTVNKTKLCCYQCTRCQRRIPKYGLGGVKGWALVPSPSLPIPCTSSVTTITQSITSSLFHSRLKTHLFHKSFPPQILSYWTAHWTSTELPSRTPYHSALCFSSSVIFNLLLVDACVGLNWLLVSF